MTFLDRLLHRDAAAVLERRSTGVAAATSWNRETRSFEAVLSTGAAVERHDARGVFDEVLDLAAGSLPDRVPLLDSHARDTVDRVIGHVSALRVVNGELRGLATLSAHNPQAQRLANEMSDGGRFGVSIGYRVNRWQDRTNGSRRERVAAEWSLLETSLVAVPADDRAGTRGTQMPTTTTTPAPGTRAATNAELRTIASTAGLTREQADAWIDRELTPDAARGEAFAEMTRRGTATASILTATHTRDADDRVQRRDAMSEGLHLRFAAPDYQPRNPRAREFAGFTVRDVAAECLRMEGVSTTGLSPATIIQRAGAHSTSDFPVILQNTLGLSLREAYTAALSPLRQLGRQRNAADFRRMERLWLSAGGFKLLPKNEGGEYHEGSIIEGTEGWKIRNYGRIFSITDEALINDQLGAFADLSRTLGTAAATLEADVIADLVKENPTLTDGHALFSAEHGNVPLAGSAIDADSLDAARVAMRRQTGPGGEILNLQPRWLLVSPEDETGARMATTAVQATEVANANPFSDLSVLVDARLDEGVWFVIAGGYDGLEYGSLEGESGPDIKTEVEFDTDNLRTRVRHRWGAGFVDHRGWYMNEGAAG